MKLYDSKLAPNARRVRIFLAEKGMSVPMVDMDLARLDQKTTAFSVLNPFQTVPVLELGDGEVISESAAICRYFEELRPEPPLFGVGALERARVEMWHRRLELQLFFPIAQAYRHTHPAAKVLEPHQIAEWAELNRGRALRAMTVVDEALRERPFVAGDRFSIADILGLVALDFIKPARITIPENLVNLRRWRETLAARPSALA
ncbi:MAG: glutathione S-transferase [Roseiarcus sp.]